MDNQNKKYSADWADFKDSLELSKEELAEIDLKVELMGKIIEIRKELGLTQSEFAKKCNIKQEYLDNLKNTTPLIVHLIKKPWLLPEEYVPYADMFNEIRKQTPYKYHRHKKEIFKFKMSSKMKYLYIFSKKIFDSRKDINKYMERIAK